MQMGALFSDRARTVLQRANGHAQRLNHEYVGTGHILLALIEEGSGVAAEVLGRHVELIRWLLERRLPSRPGRPGAATMGSLPMTPRAMRAIEFALAQAESLGHLYADTGEILLGLMHETEGVAAQLLTKFMLTPHEWAPLRVIRQTRNSGPTPHPPSAQRPEQAAREEPSEPGGIKMDSPFTKRARSAMLRANQEARRFAHEFIGTEHILLGLIQDKGGVASAVLRKMNVSLWTLRWELAEVMVGGPGMHLTVSLPTTPQATKVIEFAFEEARNLGHKFVGTGEILLGLFREPEGVAAQVLMKHGLNLDDMRRLVSILPLESEDEAAVVGPPAENAAMDEPRPAACLKCGDLNVVRVLWPSGPLDAAEQRDIDSGKAILGYRLAPKGPLWVCLRCAPGWATVHQLAMQDWEWQLAKEQAVARTDFETAARLRDAQADVGRRLAALIADLTKEK
jgi:ATP-dependent Clp protease ATP-binding subunit ClpA